MNSYSITWKTMSNNYRTDYFCTIPFAIKTWGDKVWNELSYVHVWNNPRFGLELFLKDLPFVDVTIKVI